MSPHLGVVLNVALLFREVSGMEPDGDPIELVYQVLTLARIYESAAAKVWPARKPGLIELARRFAGRVMPGSPLDAWRAELAETRALIHATEPASPEHERFLGYLGA